MGPSLGNNIVPYVHPRWGGSSDNESDNEQYIKLCAKRQKTINPVFLMPICGHTLKFGKYKNKTLKYIYQNEISYLKWLYNNINNINSLNDEDKEYITQIFDNC